MNQTLLFQQIRTLDPVSGFDQVTDILIDDNKIQEISPKIELTDDSAKIIDGNGLILAPALVDLFCHSGEPGYEERETLQTLNASAKAGGVSRVAILPNTLPVVDNPHTVTWIQNKTKSLETNFDCWGSLTKNLEGNTIAELADLAESGVVGFTDNRPHSNLQLVRKLLEYAQPFHLPIALCPTNLQLKGKGVVRECRTSIRLGLIGNPEIAETVAIASLLEIVALTKTPIHLMNISTARGVDLIKRAKEEQLPVTGSVNWHHLILNIETIASYNPHLRFDPPLGTEIDRLGLLEGIKTGVIDAISINHTPYTYEEKTVAFADAPSGSIGLELALPLLWQNLVITGELSASQLWKALSVNALKCLYQEPLKIQVGQRAEFIVFAPQQPWQITPNQLKSLSYNTYWLEKEIKGKILCNY